MPNCTPEAKPHPHFCFEAKGLVEPGVVPGTTLSAQEPVAAQPIPVFSMVVFAAHLSQLIPLELLEPKALYNLSSTRKMRMNEWVDSVLGSWGCRNKLPQTGWLRTTEVYSVPKSKSPNKIKVWAEPCCLCRLWGRMFSFPSFWQLPAILGIPWLAAASL